MRSEEGVTRNPLPAVAQPLSGLGVHGDADMRTTNTTASTLAYMDGGCWNNNKQDPDHPRQGYGSYQIELPMPVSESFYLDATTNNEAEYQTLIRLLEDERLPAGALILLDSQLLVGQLQQGWKVKAPNLRPLQARAFQLLRTKQAKLEWVKRAIIQDTLGH